MRLRFNSNLDFQVEAIESACDLFDGALRSDTGFEISVESLLTAAVANQLSLTDGQVLENLKSVQKRNGIRPDESLVFIEESIDTMEGMSKTKFYNFSIEMETGTGKTYVYLRTLLELYRRYGMRKFIIVVPSIAIREGVLKTLEITRPHFKNLYGNIPYTYYAYDSSDLSQVRQFTLSVSIEIMVMTLAAFNKASNIFRQSTDRLQGETPIHLVQMTRPILILDEPQNMESEISIAALAATNPLFALRYSATHRNPYNLIYRLTPYEAYQKGLVKRIEVASVMSEDSTILPYIQLEAIIPVKKTITAKIVIHKLMRNGTIKEKRINVRPGDTLEEITNRPIYSGFIVDEIDSRAGFVRFSNGKEIAVGQVIGIDRDAIFKSQIRYTIEEHIRKQNRLKDCGIKVLSLFFIDKVINYAGANASIRTMFDDAFNEIKQEYEEWVNYKPEDVQAAYFAQKKRNTGETILQESISGEAEKDREVYELIMRNKEQLLSFDEPVAFIFSHSALREGWDNPNLFQICTLNQTASEMKKRQEVGRGMRLAVNQSGHRVFDEQVNVLTVVANESYEEYVSSLQDEITFEYQKEIEDRYGKPLSQLSENERQSVIEEYGQGILPPKPVNARNREQARLQKAHTLRPEFKILWSKIKQKTRYAVNIDSQSLVEEVVKELEGIELAQPSVTITKAFVSIDLDNIFQALQMSRTRNVLSLVGRYPLPNVLSLMENLMEYTSPPMFLTRKTLLEIIKKAPARVQRQIIDSPNEFANVCVRIVKEKMRDQLVNGIEYRKIDDWYHMSQFEIEMVSWAEYLMAAKKSVYDHVICDSDNERRFVEGLENRDDVKLYIKLPGWFTVPTPIGEYNPDWAIVIEDRDEHGKSIGKCLYLVCESKDTTNMGALRPDERRKILCGKTHFIDALEVDNFKVVTSARELP